MARWNVTWAIVKIEWLLYCQWDVVMQCAHIDNVVHDCNSSSALPMVTLQSYVKPSTYAWFFIDWRKPERRGHNWSYHLQIKQCVTRVHTSWSMFYAMTSNHIHDSYNLYLPFKCRYVYILIPSPYSNQQEFGYLYSELQLGGVAIVYS